MAEIRHIVSIRGVRKVQIFVTGEELVEAVARTGIHIEINPDEDICLTFEEG